MLLPDLGVQYIEVNPSGEGSATAKRYGTMEDGEKLRQGILHRDVSTMDDEVCAHHD